MKYSKLEIPDSRQLIFGKASKPLTTRRKLVIGNGIVYPELNFTLPTMKICENTINSIYESYTQFAKDACLRAVDLELEGLVFEFETLIEMTTNPTLAIEITKRMNDVLEEYYQKHGLMSAIRITPNDTREMKKPPIMRSGELLESMFETFRGCALAGAEMLSIESTGGKEVHDDALLMCDISQVIFGLIVMGCRDMDFLWEQICDIADQTNTTAGGDTACGFANTAMVLADKKFIPKVFASVVRVISTIRSLVAYEKGAIGPGKDCGYENIFIKAITGYPMSMEGKSAACAHFSALGNIAAATCDLWSNESVQNIKLLSGMAPIVSLEQLIYDCRLMNVATKKEENLILRDMMVDSDARFDPQAFILTPDNVIRIAQIIVNAENYYDAALKSALETLKIIEDGYNAGLVKIEARELPWIDRLRNEITSMPSNEDQFIETVFPTLDPTKFMLDQYGLKI